MKNQLLKCISGLLTQLKDDYYYFSNHKLKRNSLHRYRVTFKELSALVNIASYVSDKNFNSQNSMKKLRSLFKHAGNVRDLQVQIKMISAYEKTLELGYRDFELFCMNGIKKYKKKFILAIEEFRPEYFIKLLKTIKKTLKPISSKQMNERIIDLLKNKWECLHHVVNIEVKNEEYHDFRTDLKQFSFVIQFYSRYLCQDKRIIPIINNIISFETEIGSWHDKVVLINILGKYLRDKTDISSTDLQFRNKIIKDIHAFTYEFEKHKIMFEESNDLFFELMKENETLKI